MIETMVTTYRGRVNKRKITKETLETARRNSDYGPLCKSFHWSKKVFPSAEEAERFIRIKVAPYAWYAVRFKDSDGHIHWMVKAAWHA